MNFLDMFVPFIAYCSADLVLDLFKMRHAKKINYNCDKCKNWDCMYKVCMEEKNKKS